MRLSINCLDSADSVTSAMGHLTSSMFKPAQGRFASVTQQTRRPKQPSCPQKGNILNRNGPSLKEERHGAGVNPLACPFKSSSGNGVSAAVAAAVEHQEKRDKDGAGQAEA